MVQYSIILILLVVASKLYLKLAAMYNIVDKPNERSSHLQPTIRGGGIVFFLAIVFFFLFNGFDYPFFVLGIFLVSIISFIDDLYTIGSPIRLIVQLAAVVLVLFQVTSFQMFIPFMLIGIFFSLGFLNIYNFMDGINGITGLYSVTVLLSLLYCNEYVFPFLNTSLLISVLLALIVFGYYNFRRKAICFAGDIGSISLGLFIVFAIGTLLYSSQNIYYLFLILVYLLDGGITILERLLRKENIFAPHRKHLYQVLTDKSKLTHLQVSAIYMIWQGVVSIVCIYLILQFSAAYSYMLLLLLNITLYLVLKVYFLNKPNIES